MKLIVSVPFGHHIVFPASLAETVAPLLANAEVYQQIPGGSESVYRPHPGGEIEMALVPDCRVCASTEKQEG